ncbi:uncharacterized protein LOC124926231 [Impatiens glandulifera]|uniref:uncharacterized protein LOC124926231 n=1 Tax=Impatiens glandulifera TaxID=253017 RepID=UPI001FB1482B|nr:uncharacterized protein LOC124926231 [Impatiens glandulifera]
MASSSGNGSSGGNRIVEVVNGKSCSRMFTDMSSSFSFRGIQSFGPADSSFSSQSAVSESMVDVQSNGPFSGLVICVTGLSKEARQQVRDATERLGGQYSPHLHHKCTHLVIQSFSGRKFEHALKHGDSNGLFLVTLGWFVESVRRNERLSEKLYSVKNAAENNKTSLQYAGSESPYLPAAMQRHAKQSNTTLQFSEKDNNAQAAESALSGHTLYIDVDVSPEIRSKILEVIAEEGATVVDRWFVGCNASYVVCEGPSMHKYMGYSNIVTPQWVLRTAKEKRIHKLVNLSADLARQIGTMLDNVQLATCRESSLLESVNEVDEDPTTSRIEEHCIDKQMIVNMAKEGVRKRRCRRMQTCQTPLRPITPSILLECICWSVSEPTSTASIYLDTSSVVDNGSEQKISVNLYGKDGGKESEATFMNHSRSLAESEKTELIFKNHLLSILYPVDRYSEVGPCSRTYFSSTGFTCLQVLDIIYTFYQENMSDQEIETAIHTDSRQADRLRAAYCNNETANKGYVTFKRIDFLGSRKCFEMLKRVIGDNNCNVYELLLRA